MAEQEFPEDGGKNLDSYKGRAFELCLAIYRITKLFPAGEALISQLRQGSSKIVVFLATGKISDTILKIEEVKIYLEIAKNQKWLVPLNFDLLIAAYSLLLYDLAGRAIKSRERGEKTVMNPPPEISLSLPKEEKEKEIRFIIGEAQLRQEKIVEYFNKNKETTVNDLRNILGKVSDRTVRNDLAVLMGRNFIRRVGRRRGVRYLLNA
ncbi:MAG: hypothetical protein A2Y98_02210 [Candidatus Portnoybacteria bacterium RBG_19FT_COMBO_36_7]|uniref:HTH deoR-type domain-containing protein n=1 Tax=Candidatus Portnoybacteria bacterium RBG_19FT_COMBO_36_7 TaxID=1801992 RepID=A0A1G2F7S9_9BACT|nr:MAG: hypothetical protein A2Y98_02210 [Candidatus Portnoybacteria bacterium RBG_19FT_COMBO_36_7]